MQVSPVRNPVSVINPTITGQAALPGALRAPVDQFIAAPAAPRALPNTTAAANKFFLTQWGPTKYTAGGHPYGFMDCGPTSGVMALSQLGLMEHPSPSKAFAAIDRVRDAALGFNSNYSRGMSIQSVARGLTKL